MSDIKWIKIAVDVFDNRKIRQIEKLPDGDTIIVIWFKLLCLAGTVNEDGLIVMTKDIAYTEDMLISEFNRPINTIRLALNTFMKFGMIDIVDSIYRITNWEKYQNVEKMAEIREYNKIAKQKERERKKLLQNVNDKSMTSQGQSRQCQGTDIDIDIDKEIEKEKEKKIKNKRLFVEDSIEFQLSKKLLDYILRNHPNYKMPNLQNWAKHIDYMIRLDKRTPEQINDIIVFSQEDSFWKSNVLSTEKLRERFDQLWIKKKNGKPKSTFEILQAEYEKEVENEQNRNHQITGSN